MGKEKYWFEVIFYEFQQLIMEKPLLLDKKTALVKAESWCAYQERSQHEMRMKLLDWGLRHDELEEVLTELITTNFLNEERFAMAYVSGKVNIKKWGRIKIKQGLKFKKVSDRLIKKALNSIDEEKYEENLRETLTKKAATINEKDAFKRRSKLTSYLLGKGFETDLIFLVLKDNNLT